ncbi:unnamed protein product [Prunus armeniaca]
MLFSLSATTFKAKTFPAVTVEPATGIGPAFTDSSPASFSLLRPPNPTPESSPPLAQPSSAAIAPTLMDHLPVGPDPPGIITGPPAPPTRHRQTLLVRQAKNTWGPCRQLKTAKVTQVTNSRINIGYDERHRATPTAELHSLLAHNIGHVVRTHCPMQ